MRTMNEVTDEVADALDIADPHWIIKADGDVASATLNDNSVRIVMILREDGWSFSSYTMNDLDKLIQRHNTVYRRHPVNTGYTEPSVDEQIQEAMNGRR